MYGMHGYAQANTVCLGDNAVLKWDLMQYSEIHNIQIRHHGTLMVTITSSRPAIIILTEQFENLINVTVTENWFIKMRIYNVTNIKEKSTYTCTITFSNWNKSTISEDIIIIDPDNELSFTSTVNQGCTTVYCLSEYNVKLLDSKGWEIKSNTCLSEMDTGIFSCCFLDTMLCPDAHCKFINVSKTNGSTETITPTISMDGQVYSQNTGLIIGILLAAVVVVGVVLVVIVRKKIWKKRNRNCDRPRANGNADYTSVRRGD